MEKVKGTMHLRFCYCAALLLLGSPLAAQAATLTGTVTGPDGAMVANASVWLRQWGRIDTQTTNAQGEFRFTGVDEVSTLVLVLKEGLALGGTTQWLIGDAALEVVLSKPAPLNLVILDAKLRPVPGARIKSIVIEGLFAVPVAELAAAGFPLLRSNDDGELHIGLLPKGVAVSLSVSHLKYAERFEPYLWVQEKPQTITLLPGIKLRGKVTHRGRGVSSALIAILRSNESGPAAIAETQSDREGYFSVRLAAGDYQVTAQHPEFSLPEPAPISLQNDGDANAVALEMIIPRIIAGKLELEDGLPCPGARIVYTSRHGLRYEAYSASSGGFRLQVGAASGQLSIYPPAGYFSDLGGDIAVRMDAGVKLDLGTIIIRPLPVFSGVVRDAQGAPAPNVLISSLEPGIPLWTLTDDEGKFQLRTKTAPSNNKVRFRAEHAVRLLRGGFTANPKRDKEIKVKLAPFTPNAARTPPRFRRNNLEPLMGEMAPEIKCDSWFNTPPLDLQALKGKVVVLHFWAGFDGSKANVNQIDELRALSALLSGVDDVVFLGIHDNMSLPGEVARYVKNYGIQYPVGRDTDALDMVEGYGVNLLPQIVLLDKRGRIRYHQTRGRLLELIKVLRRER